MGRTEAGAGGGAAARRWAGWLAAGWLGAVLSGCGGGGVAPPVSAYRLAGPPALPAPARPLPGLLAVGRLQADGPLNGRAMLYTVPGRPLELRSTGDRRWIAPPPRLLQAYLVAGLRAARAARNVAVQDARLRPRYRLRGELLAFEHRRGRGEVRLEAVLRLEAAREGRVYWSRRVLERVPVTGDDPHALARAFSRAAEGLLKALLAGVAETAGD